MNTPQISVVVTCYNRAHYLQETLACLQRQTFQDWEAIIVDDHSEEDLEAVVKSFEEPRFRYMKNEGERGPSVARNVGNRAALAPIIAVADSDDIILPRRLQVTMDHFAQYPGTQLFYGNIYTFQDGEYDFKFYRHFAPYDRATLYERDFVPHVTVAYRKEDILALPYNEELKSAIDYDMLLSFADRNMVFGYTTEPLVLYRRHADQISTDPARKEQQLANAVKIREAHAQYLSNPIL